MAAITSTAIQHGFMTGQALDQISNLLTRYPQHADLVSRVTGEVGRIMTSQTLTPQESQLLTMAQRLGDRRRAGNYIAISLIRRESADFVRLLNTVPGPIRILEIARLPGPSTSSNATSTAITNQSTINRSVTASSTVPTDPSSSDPYRMPPLSRISPLPASLSRLRPEVRVVAASSSSSQSFSSSSAFYNAIYSGQPLPPASNKPGPYEIPKVSGEEKLKPEWIPTVTI